MDQQQPEKEWVAGMAHQHVEGAQLEQLGRDVTETEKRIKLLDSQAVRTFSLCRALPCFVRVVPSVLSSLHTPPTHRPSSSASCAPWRSR